MGGPDKRAAEGLFMRRIMTWRSSAITAQQGAVEQKIVSREDAE